jgi:hypothetical protein
LHPLRTMNLLSMCERVFVVNDGKLTPAADITSEDFAIMTVESGRRSAPSVVSIEQIRGRWPDGAWVVTQGNYLQDGARIMGMQGGEFHYANDAWKEQPAESVTSWSQGRNLALREDELAVVDGRKDLGPPKLSRSNHPGCKTEVAPFAVDALPGGEVFVAGLSCADETRFAVERFGADAIKGTVDTFPGAPKKDVLALEIKAATPSRAYMIVEHRELYRFDGKSWAPMPKPDGGDVVGSVVEEAGGIWVLFGKHEKFGDQVSKVGHLHEDGHWTMAKIPPPNALGPGGKEGAKLTPAGVIASARDQMWLSLRVVGRHSVSTGSVMLSTRSEKVEIPDPLPNLDADAGRDATAEGVDASSEPTAITSACTTPFVILYAVSKQTPANFTYPATRDALAGTPLAALSFVEYENDGRRILGAKVASREEGQQLVDRITEKVKGSKPGLVCLSPTHIVRALTMK